MNASSNRLYARALFAVLLVAGVLAGVGAVAEEKTPIEITLPRPVLTYTPPSNPKGAVPLPDKPRAPFFAPKGTALLSLKAPVTSSTEPAIGSLDLITDGDKEPVEGAWVEFDPGLQWVQIDLGKQSDIHAIVVWHLFTPGFVFERPVGLTNRVYKDVVVQISNDVDFRKGVSTVFNNDKDNSSGLGVGQDPEYVEGYEGWLIPVSGIRGRYARLYSNGNNLSVQNEYVEVDVYGIQR